MFNNKDPLRVHSQLRAVSTTLKVELRWQTGCPSYDGCSFIAEVDEALADDQELSAFLWMPSMGHGSSPIKATRLGPTTWQMNEVFFIMPGHWEVVVQLKSQTRVIDEVRLDYTL